MTAQTQSHSCYDSQILEAQNESENVLQISPTPNFSSSLENTLARGVNSYR